MSSKAEERQQQLAAYIKREVAKTPPLSQQQLDQIAALLRPTRARAAINVPRRER